MTAIFLIVVAVLVGAIGLNIYIEYLSLKEDIEDYEKENTKKYELERKYHLPESTESYHYLSIDENIEKFKLKTPTKFL